MFTENYLKKLEFDSIKEKIKNYCFSNMGIKKTEMLTPEINAEDVRFKHKLINELIRYIIEEERLPFTNFINLSDFVERIDKGALIEPVDILGIALSIRMYFSINSTLNKRENYDLIKSMFTIEALSDNIYFEIINCIKPDGYILSGASADLERIRKRISACDEMIRRETERFFKEMKSKNYSADDIISVRDNFNCVAVKANVKNRIDGFVIDSSSTGQTLFVVPGKVLQIYNEKSGYVDEEHREIIKIIARYCAFFRENLSSLQVIDRELIYFDHIYAVSQYAKDRNYNSPEITDKNTVNIIEGRHPLLGECAVPLNVKIGSSYNTLIITGPNTGGKTVVLKTIGLFVVMVQCGIPIPASSSSVIGVFDSVFIDIGDEQSIEKSLSTFSAHIQTINNIISKVTDKSLILLDELGGGTDPHEGSALAVGIIEYLKHKKCLLIVTTHYSSLANYAAENEDIENASMEFDSINLKPIYNLLTGIPGKSRALDISKRLGLPDEILQTAYNSIDDTYIKADKILESLENEKQKINLIKKELEEKQNKIDKISSEISEKLTSIKIKEKELIKIIKNEEIEFLNESRKKFENLIKEIKTQGVSSEKIKEGHEIFQAIKSDIKERTEEINKIEQKSSDKFSVNQNVILKENNVKGTIIDYNSTKNEYIVQFGIIKLNCKANQLIKDKSKQQNHLISVTKSVSQRKLELDMRGMRYEDADIEIEKFIDQAVINKFSQIKFIHGKGTGVLRKLIQNKLKNNKFIRNYDFEKINDFQTNYGVTVAELALQ